MFSYSGGEVCEPQQWACPSGKCIPITKVCDNTNDCDKGEDEGATCSMYHKLLLIFCQIQKMIYYVSKSSKNYILCL